MRTVYCTAFLIVSALFTAWTSWISFTAPVKFGKQLGFLLAGVDGTNEIRAQYGGFFLAVTAASVLALWGILPRQAALIVNAVVFGGLIAGRLVSLAVDGSISGYGSAIRLLYVIDAAGFVLSITLLLLTRSKTIP